MLEFALIIKCCSLGLQFTAYRSRFRGIGRLIEQARPNWIVLRGDCFSEQSAIMWLLLQRTSSGRKRDAFDKRCG